MYVFTASFVISALMKFIRATNGVFLQRAPVNFRRTSPACVSDSPISRKSGK